MASLNSKTFTSKVMETMSFKTCLVDFPCHKRNPLLQHHLGQVFTAHQDLKHIYRPRLSMTVGLLDERHLVPLPLKHSPQTRTRPTFTTVTRTFLHCSRQPRATRPNATRAFALKSVLIPQCFSKMGSRVLRLFLSLTQWDPTASPRAMEQHRMHPVRQALPCRLTNKAQIKGARLVDSHTSVVLTITKQGARGLDLDLVLDPSLIKQPPTALLRLHRNLLPP